MMLSVLFYLVLHMPIFRREREGCKLEYYYNEFVKRDWYKDKNLYDSTGRRIRFKVVNGNTITKMQEEPNKLARRNSSDYEDSDEYGASEEEAGDENAYRSDASGTCVRSEGSYRSLTDLAAPAPCTS